MKACHSAAYPIAKARGLRGGFSVTAVERGMLICCEPSISLMHEAIRVLAQDEPDLNILSSIISKLRTSAKEDVGNAERK